MFTGGLQAYWRQYNDSANIETYHILGSLFSSRHLLLSSLKLVFTNSKDPKNKLDNFYKKALFLSTFVKT
jgi:hypothetical protein